MDKQFFFSSVVMLAIAFVGGMAPLIVGAMSKHLGRGVIGWALCSVLAILFVSAGPMTTNPVEAAICTIVVIMPLSSLCVWWSTKKSIHKKEGPSRSVATWQRATGARGSDTPEHGTDE
jgi:hypothetical protein